MRNGKTKSVFRFLAEEAERLRQQNRIRASESCKTTLNSIRRFREDVDFTFDRLNSEMLEDYSAYLKRSGVVRNTISYYMRCLRSVYNRAIEKGLTVNRQPFRHVYTSKDKTVKRSLELEDIRAIKSLDLSTMPSLDFARDIFMLSLYTRGMSFVDLAFIRKTDIRNGRLTYRRKKTGQLLEVEWIKCMQDIVDKHSGECQTPYLLPIITDCQKDERLQYQNKLRNVNRNLKKVAILANLSVQLSSYYARHTWATLAQSMDVPLSVISEAMGHDSEKTTKIYLRSIQSPIVDKTNRRILETI